MTLVSRSAPLGIIALVLVIGGVTAGCSESTTLVLDGSADIDGGSGDDGGDPGVDTGLPDDAGPPPDDGSVTTFDSGPPVACSTPGALETVACGMCGTVDRFCTAEGTWAYGTCEGEGGECSPGSVDEIACGDCGTQAARCTTSCTWETTGACTDEGECTPGDRTRTSDGCATGETREVLCSDTCDFEPATACVADGCPTPGTLESVACGMCGRQDRFCNAAHVWEYGACGGEGVCMPGTTGTQACGMCGTQGTRCTDLCTWASFGACTGEGVCTPGATMRTSTGCSTPGATHVMQCDGACGYTIEVTPCTSTRPVDVTFVFETTGSNDSRLMTDIPLMQASCIEPLLALADVNVGASYTGEFPVSPYGSTTGDQPFQGGIEPGTSATTLMTELAGRPHFSGGDGAEATLESLSMLAGGPAAYMSTPLSCSSGRVAGGCWRTGAQRVIVVHTDSAIHNMAPESSYTGITPAPETWPNVRTRLMSSGTLVIFIDAGAGTGGQYATILSELGQPASDRILHGGNVSAACGSIVARVRALAGL